MIYLTLADLLHVAERAIGRVSAVRGSLDDVASIAAWIGEHGT
jgi:hypothetical protein